MHLPTNGRHEVGSGTRGAKPRWAVLVTLTVVLGLGAAGFWLLEGGGKQPEAIGDGQGSEDATSGVSVREELPEVRDKPTEVRVVSWKLTREFEDLLEVYKADEGGRGADKTFVVVEATLSNELYQTMRKAGREDYETRAYVLNIRGGSPLPLESLVEQTGRPDGVVGLTLVFVAPESLAQTKALDLIIDGRLRVPLLRERMSQ